MSGHELAALVGFDPWVCARLPAPLLAALVRRAEATLYGCLLASLALGYGVLLATASALAGLAMALSVLALLVNLVRLATAGGGAPHDARDYQPGLGPLVWLTLLGLLAAQPAQLLVRGLGAPGQLARALAALWAEPWAAGWGTLGCAVVMLAPLYLAQAAAAPALVAYEALRRRRERALVALDDARAQGELTRLLAGYRERAR